MNRILITGANRGLGLELTRQFLDKGDTQVFATCRKPDEAEALQALKAQHSERVILLRLDVTDDDSITQAAAEVSQHVDGLDVLINNAAINPPGRFQSLEALDADGMMFMFRVNTVGPFMVVKAFLELLKNGIDTRIINVSTQMGSMQWKTSGGHYGYSPSKAALNMVTRCLAADLRPHGITTITLHPGWVQTDMGGTGASLTPEESVKGILNLIDNLTPDQNGQFFKWTGEPHPW